jgi:hypothetical protein
MSAATPTEVIHAYRALYRGLLQAVQYSAPARYVARDQLRAAFRERGAVFNAPGIARTLEFLGYAARDNGLEHRVLRNLLRTRYERVEMAKRPWAAVRNVQRKGNMER